MLIYIAIHIDHIYVKVVVEIYKRIETILYDLITGSSLVYILSFHLEGYSTLAG